MGQLLPKEFYLQPDVVSVSKQLLGKILWTNLHGEGITAGKIVETEAYAGAIDRASHAYGNRRTKRTETMYQQGGITYIYLCYGIHNLLNVVTNAGGTPHAVLIRAIEPLEGIELMLVRRQKNNLQTTLTSGPGSLTVALGISRQHNAIGLLGEEIWITDEVISIPDQEIIASPRVGVAYAKEDALLPWRFRVKGSEWTSPAK